MILWFVHNVSGVIGLLGVLVKGFLQFCVVQRHKHRLVLGFTSLCAAKHLSMQIGLWHRHNLPPSFVIYT